jgi:hypothetical protein
MTWQPFENAPKDGSRILACGTWAHNYAVVSWGKFGDDDEYVGWRFGDDKNDPMHYRQWHYLTHWMPLPALPDNSRGNAGA